jgi:hypothetical protein
VRAIIGGRSRYSACMRPGPLIATLAFLLLGVVALVLSFMAMPTRLKVGVGLDDREPPSHASCRTTARRCG